MSVAPAAKASDGQIAAGDAGGLIGGALLGGAIAGSRRRRRGREPPQTDRQSPT
jgi:hypothetical protein